MILGNLFSFNHAAYNCINKTQQDVDFFWKKFWSQVGKTFLTMHFTLISCGNYFYKHLTHSLNLGVHSSHHFFKYDRIVHWKIRREENFLRVVAKSFFFNFEWLPGPINSLFSWQSSASTFVLFFFFKSCNTRNM